MMGLSRKHLYEGLKASLERMQLEYVDLVFCHRPDPRTPIEETVRGMNNLIDRGLAFYWVSWGVKADSMLMNPSKPVRAPASGALSSIRKPVPSRSPSA